jgi:hypothetical protein
LGGEISSKRPGDDTDWELATSILYGPDLQRSAMEETLRRGFRKMSLGVARSEFQALMYRLIIVCRVQPRFNWNGSAWAIDFDSIGGSNLPAILAVQLMAQLGGKALRKCRTCPNWFQPNGRQVYCGKCGIQAAWRSAWQASEQRKREAKTLSISLPARVEKGRKNEV